MTGQKHKRGIYKVGVISTANNKYPLPSFHSQRNYNLCTRNHAEHMRMKGKEYIENIGKWKKAIITSIAITGI